jgi:hypothetical protein
MISIIFFREEGEETQKRPLNGHGIRQPGVRMI